MIKSLQKAMALLSVISDGRGEPVRIMDISEKTGIPRPSCAHILETLAHDGYVVRLSHTDGYVLGPSLYHLTRSGRYDERLVALSRPILHSIEKRSGGTVILSVIKGGHKFIIDYLDGEQNVFPERQRIITDDIYRTATGRVILARMNGEGRRAIYDRYGAPDPSHWSGIFSFTELSERLDALAREPVVISGLDEEGRASHEFFGLASPILKNGACIGALGIAYRSSIGEYADKELIALASSLVRRGAATISQKCSD